MAKPELEDGYTPIANEILEKLARISLSPNQWQVLLIIIRKTYGFHKKVDHIANSQIGEATGLCKAVVSRCLKGLSDMQLITRKGKVIGFQKDWEQWKKLAIPSTSEELAESSTLGTELAEQSTPKSKQNSQPKLAIRSPQLAEQSTKVSSCAVTQKIKDTITKETIQKKRYFFDNILLTEEEYQKLVEWFGEAGAKDRLEALSLYKKSRGKKYKDDYATVLAWEHREKKTEEQENISPPNLRLSKYGGSRESLITMIYRRTKKELGAEPLGELISNLRTKSIDELLEMIKGVE